MKQDMKEQLLIKRPIDLFISAIYSGGYRNDSNRSLSTNGWNLCGNIIGNL